MELSNLLDSKHWDAVVFPSRGKSRRVWEEADARFVEYIRSLGGLLVKEDYIYFDDGDLVFEDEAKWVELFEKHLSEIEAKTGMIPFVLYFPLEGYEGCLLPRDLAEKVLLLGTFP